MATTEVSANINDHGVAVDEQKKKAQCNYCAKVVSGFTRLKYHLAGERGDVSPCGEVPATVKELMKEQIQELEKGKSRNEIEKINLPDISLKRKPTSYSKHAKERKIGMIQNAGSNSGEHTINDPASRVNGMVSFSVSTICSERASCDQEEEDIALRKAKKCIGRFLYEMGTDFNVTTHMSLRRMINGIHNCHQVEYEFPSHQELKGWILQDEVKEMLHHLNGIRDTWATTGCSIIVDGWKNKKGRNLMNFLVDCPWGPICFKLCDISSFSDDVDALVLLFEQVIVEIGVENVVQVVSHSASECMKSVGSCLMDKHPTLFWTVSASHCIEMILKKIGMMGTTGEVLYKAKTITRFIYNHAMELNLLRNYTLVHDLVRPSRSKSAFPFLTLQNIVSEKESLEKMFISSEWKTSCWASTREGKRVADIVSDPSFWTGAEVVLKATVPLVGVLCSIIGGDRGQMCYIYETMDAVKEEISLRFADDESQYMPFWELIDEVWDNHLHSALHAAANHLNPGIFYSRDYNFDKEVYDGIKCCIEHMVPDEHIQNEIWLQLEQYKDAKGDFGLGKAAGRRNNFHPG